MSCPDPRRTALSCVSELSAWCPSPSVRARRDRSRRRVHTDLPGRLRLLQSAVKALLLRKSGSPGVIVGEVMRSARAG
jgi:hypothetical protein